MLNNLLLLFFMTMVVCDEQRKPNFVIILTDDQDVALGGMNPMKNVQRFIGSEGVTFTESFVTSPLCCPSRASILTGLYVHNHMTRNNSISGGCYGPTWKRHETNTFATVLKKAGYNTFYAGKYMNAYGSKAAGGPEKVPPGWTEWHGLVGNSVYYNYTLSNNGVPTHSTDQYLTDVIRDMSISFIENQTEAQPFLMVLSPPAPHDPFTPAPRHKKAFKNVTAVRHPNFNTAFEDKHWLIRMPPSPLPEGMMAKLDDVYRSRWEALLSVDEMVADVVAALDNHSFLDNTYVIYTSDNGYHIGQFSQVYDKRQPYEADIRVPLVIRGPGVDKNATSNQPILNIDLAPTIIELAGLEVPNSMDGRSFKLSNIKEAARERNMLVEYHGEGSTSVVDEKCPWKYDGSDLYECYPSFECKCQDAKNNTFGCLRHIAERINMKFCAFNDDQKFIEMYNLAEDPYELKNIFYQVLPSIKHWYKLILSRMLKCSGAKNCDNPLEVVI